MRIEKAVVSSPGALSAAATASSCSVIIEEHSCINSYII
jgi:hypothetical protein